MKPHRRFLNRPGPVRPRAFSLELLKGCNLRCGYCYYAEREEAYDPRTRMSRETAQRSLDVLFRDGVPGEPLHVNLFGGEPLLDFSLVRHVVEYGERRSAQTGRAMSFEINTNGTRFTDDVIAFLNDHRVRVVVSLDGPPEVHDAARPGPGGGSYARIAPQLERFLRSRREVEDLAGLTWCSVVVTRRELDLAKIVRHLEGLGFDRIILTPATDLSGAGWGISPDDLPRLLSSYDELAADYEERLMADAPVSVRWFPTLMGRLLSGERKTAFCGGGRDFLGIAANGDAHLCFRFFEDDRFSMGDVWNGLDGAVTDRLDALPPESRPACSRCWARHFCGGGCHHENLVSTGGLGDPNPVTCEILRHGMSRTLESYARLSRAGKLPGRAAPGEETGMNDADRREPGFDGTSRPRLSETCHMRDLESERVVYEPTTHEVVILNATARFIVEHCDGERTVDDIVAVLRRRFDAPADRLRADVVAVLTDLSRKGVIAT